MSEDTGGRRRSGADGAGRPDASGSRPVTAAGRRRRGAADGDGETGGTTRVATTARGDKGAPTPSRDAARASSEGSVIARLQRFLREVVAELRKVHWPTRRQIVVYTVVVLVFVAFMVTLVGLLDVGFQKLTFALFG
ncbi:preprotein translocase subunit SecE [Actinomycetospora sp. TBRC 11914]|uniref:preprotein translocase subunit SecE n=1 Tax=Actinomycetospora sp. TBRC 11914 TaxID=2729387 RepID=UPI00145F94D7|nr:preprotein translocase subunit SecE [Actinomycetospora sp. TBRC 11914]NMO93379.1 preprotein translocase subunit SecE [Actinomycetospora sp. TBRC 11914]